MSGKTDRRIRKGLNEIERNNAIRKRQLADELALELLRSPFKYRFLFAMKILFRKRVK